MNGDGMSLQLDEDIVIQYLKVVKEEPTNGPLAQVLVT
jgi:hypothetical protein